MKKPFRAIISEFLGNPANPVDAGALGTLNTIWGLQQTESLMKNGAFNPDANPSHLEVVNAVVVGRARAKQAQRNDASRKKC